MVIKSQVLTYGSGLTAANISNFTLKLRYQSTLPSHCVFLRSGMVQCVDNCSSLRNVLILLTVIWLSYLEAHFQVWRKSFQLYACLFSSNINVMFGINRGRIYSNTASYIHGDAVNFSFHSCHYKTSSKKNINFLLTKVQIGSGAHPTFLSVYTRGSVHRHARAEAWTANDDSSQLPK